MRLAYMDEAGNTGRKCDEPNQPIHLISTLVVDEENVAPLHEHIREIGRRHCAANCNEDEFEFHGHDLYAGSGYFAEMEPAERVEIYDEILQGIELAEGEIIVRGVEKAGLERRYVNPFHPHDIALMYTIESIERMAREEDCRVLLIADDRSHHRHDSLCPFSQQRRDPADGLRHLHHRASGEDSGWGRRRGRTISGSHRRALGIPNCSPPAD